MNTTHIELPDGNKIPIIGMGTWQMVNDDCRQNVEYALEIGYRHIDTADVYGNHKEIRKAIEASGLLRNELFITTKIWREDLEPQKIHTSCVRSLEELGLSYIDLLLIHWPNKNIPIKESIDGFKVLKNEGLIKSYGVSNFTLQHIKESLQYSKKIATNQIELHPSLFDKGLVDFCHHHNISVTAYSPLGRGGDLHIKTIQKLAEKYDKSPSQIILNWIMQKNIIIIPKSSNKDRIKENYESNNFEMESKDYHLIDSCNRNNRLINPSFAEF